MFHSVMPGHGTTSISGKTRSSATFVLNGRFFGQAVTGVQRYAREVVREIDLRLTMGGGFAQLVVPPTVNCVPDFTSIALRRTSGISGHFWEQAVLPLLAEPPILNLCNTAPLAVQRQVVCIHDTNVFDAPASYSPAFRVAYRLLLPSLARRAAVVTSVSRFSAQRLAQHIGINANSIEVMYNGHEHVYRWNAQASTLARLLSGIRPFVLLLGSWAWHKNAAFILCQASALQALGIDLVVAGGTAEIFARSKIVEAPNIHHLGFVTDDDLAWLYANALCLAFPSRSEGFGLPLVEAMALGCPIVASNQSCMPEICGNATLFADPDDAIAWQAHFRTLVSSRHLQSDLRAKGLERVKMFSWRNSGQAYVDLLTRL